MKREHHETPADPRLDEWVDGLLDDAEREAFRREAALNPALGDALEDWERTVALVRELPPRPAPADTLAAVQARLRRRSRGRWFALETRYRFPYEAAFNIVLLGLMVAAWLVAVPAPDREPLPVDPAIFRLGGGSGDTAGAVLSVYGAPRVVPGSVGAAGVTWEVELSRDRLPALAAELDLYPALRLLGPPLPTVRDGEVVVRVRADRR